MPWSPADATKHNFKIKSDRHARMWADVANSILKRTGDEGRAIAGANSQVDQDISRTNVAKKKATRPTNPNTEGGAMPSPTEGGAGVEPA